MPPIRRSNRAPKPRVFLDPYITPPHRRQIPAFTIYSDTPEAPPEALPEASPEASLEVPLEVLPEAYQPQNMPKDTRPIKLFQLFFPVKEVENIIKNSNSRAVFIGLCPWKPLTVIESNNEGSRGQFRGSKTQLGCQECNKPLCKIGDYKHLWHRNLTNY